MRAQELHRRRCHRSRASRASIVQTDLPHRNVRSNSLEVCGNIMAVAYQTGTHGATPAGIELFDISTPEQPRSISFFDCSGPHSRGVHQLWFVDGKTVHCSQRRRRTSCRATRTTTSAYRAFDVSDPAKPRELGRWWYPGHERGRRGAAGAAASEIRHRLPRPQHQRLSGAARPRLCRLYRRRRLHPRHLRHRPSRSWSGIGTRIRRSPALPTR